MHKISSGWNLFSQLSCRSRIRYTADGITCDSLCTAVALAGVFLYSRAKRLKPKPKAA
ncbi:hypothetical protein COLO4_29049 [Corchorus olitorius]|uniref:Uncharacterized protein n=1 Tax=Corchorus olitorius TaxID=93759 RepID=A0A1R3HGM6_9ROSI|nr:hypothetical protein COLO4_29049 [Corchorus olitorius]